MSCILILGIVLFGFIFSFWRSQKKSNSEFSIKMIILENDLKEITYKLDKQKNKVKLVDEMQQKVTTSYTATGQCITDISFMLFETTFSKKTH